MLMRYQRRIAALLLEDTGVCYGLGSLLSMLSEGGGDVRWRPSEEVGFSTPMPHSRIPPDCFRRSLEIVLKILSTSSEVGNVI